MNASGRWVRRGWIAGWILTLMGGSIACRSGREASKNIDPEPGNKGKCGEIRSALSIYYSDNQGIFPAHLDSLVPKYLSEIPTLNGIGNHPPSRAVAVVSAPRSSDTGGWIYMFNPASPRHGEVSIDCTHSDGKAPWSSF